MAGVIREAAAARNSGQKRVILFNLCGHGYFDMSAYTAYLNGELSDDAYPEAEIAAAMSHLPQA